MQISATHQEAIEYLNSILPENKKITKISKTKVYFKETVIPKKPTLKIPSFIHLPEPYKEKVMYVDLDKIPHDCNYSIRTAADSLQKIPAIKSLRSLTGIGLKEAKDVIEYNFSF